MKGICFNLELQACLGCNLQEFTKYQILETPRSTSEEQKKAVLSESRYLRIVAGAGKTDRCPHFTVIVAF